MPTYKYTRNEVANRGNTPIRFLGELVEFGRAMPEFLYAPNKVPVDIFTVIKSGLGRVIGKDASGTPIYGWRDLAHRRAALMEAMRVHAGFESSWSFTEGVDKSNKSSMLHKEREETGVFQVSFDSLRLGGGTLRQFAGDKGIDNVNDFIVKMKQDHQLAFEYYVRLARVSVSWAGPLLRSGKTSVYPYLSRDAVAEFETLLT